jgi:hypothetical protein
MCAARERLPHPRQRRQTQLEAAVSVSGGMGRRRGAMLAGASAIAVVLSLSALPTGATAAVRWWPASPVMGPAGGSFGLAANRNGGFLLVSSGAWGKSEAHAGYCTPAGAWMDHALAPVGYIPYSNFGSDLPGSPVFAPDGTATVVGLEETGAIGKRVFASEGPAAAPELLSLPAPTASVIRSSRIGGPDGLDVAGGPRGDIAVIGVGRERFENTEVATKVAGSSTRTSQTLPGYGEQESIPLAVDGFGDVTILRNAYSSTPPHGEIANAYFAPPGQSFRPLSVPGNFFTRSPRTPQGAARSPATRRADRAARGSMSAVAKPRADRSAHRC